MRTGALVLGIIAGLAGIVSAVLALFVGGLGGAFEAEGSGTIVGLGWRPCSSLCWDLWVRLYP
jgi:hypothetical protein